MGNIRSQIIPKFPADVSVAPFAVILFPEVKGQNEVTLVYGGRHLRSGVRDVIRSNWKPGLKSEYASSNYITFTLNGQPFANHYFFSEETKIDLVRLIMAMLEKSMNLGWSFKAMVNLFSNSKMDSLFLDKWPSNGVWPLLCAVDLQSYNQLNLVGVPRDLLDKIRDLITQYWPTGITQERVSENQKDVSFVLEGVPWRAHDIGFKLMDSRNLILNILSTLHERGFVFLGSGHTQHSSQDVATIFFANSMFKTRQPTLFLFAPHQENRVITVNAPNECVDAVQQCIEFTWPGSLEGEYLIGNLMSFRVLGEPFCNSELRSIDAVLLVIRVLREFRRLGWRIYCALDMTKSANDTTSFILMQDVPATRDFMAVRLSTGDSFKLIQAPRNIELEVAAELQRWNISARCTKCESGWTFKLIDSLRKCHTAISIVISKLESLRWGLVAVADLSASVRIANHMKNPADYETLIFEENPVQSTAFVA